MLSLLRRHWAFCAAALVYLLVACPWLARPGLYYDEVLFANAALGNLDGSFIVYQWTFGSLRLPLMLMPYLGTVKSLLYTPLFALLPTSAVTVRLPMVLAGLGTVWVTYRLMGRLFNQTTAALAAWLIATDPGFIFPIRLDWGPVALMLLFKMGSLYAFVHFAETRRLRYLALGALLAGLGLYDKSNFVWYLVALPMAALAAWGRPALLFVTWRRALAAAAFFALGCWPLVPYNLTTGGATLAGQVGGIEHPLAVAWYKARLVQGLLAGNEVYTLANHQRVQPLFAGAQGRGLLAALDLPGTLLPWAAVGALGVVGLLWRKHAARTRRVLVFLAVLSLVIFAQFFVAKHATGPHHALLLSPFPHLVIAYGFYLVMFETRLLAGDRSRLNKVVAALGVGLLVMVVAVNLLVDAKYLISFARDGGRGVWSDAIYDLAGYAQAQDEQTYLLMDWGFNTQLLLLSRGTIEKQELFWPLLDGAAPEADEIADLYAQAQLPDHVFVFHAPAYTIFDRPRQVFDAMVAQNGLRTETVRVFNQRDGEAVYVLERVMGLESRP